MPYIKKSFWGGAKPAFGGVVDKSNSFSDRLIFACLMNEGAGYTTWDIASHNPGTLNGGGGTSVKAAFSNIGYKSGKSILFTRTGAQDGSYVTFPYISKYSIARALTAVAYIRITSDFNSRILHRFDPFTYTQGWGLGTTATTLKLSASVRVSGAYQSVTSSSNALVLNKWHQVAMVFGDGVLTIYVDAVQVGQTTFTGADITQNTTSPLRFGFDDQYDPFPGNIDSGFVWNRCLSVSELQLLKVNPYQMITTPKRRIISQVVSAAASTYQSKMCLMGVG